MASRVNRVTLDIRVSAGGQVIREFLDTLDTVARQVTQDTVVYQDTVGIQEVVYQVTRDFLVRAVIAASVAYRVTQAIVDFPVGRVILD